MSARAAASNTQSLERVAELCAALSLNAVGDQFVTLADDAARHKHAFTDYLSALLEAEYAMRQERSRQMMLKLATLPTVKTLEELDYEAAPGLPKAKIQELSSLAFVERR
ncbi:MAG: ATP-binding protein, partial [Pseudomonadota bacterium]